MFTAKFFLGFPIEPAFQEKLSRLNPDYLSLFIQDNDTYLREVVHGNMHYLGKATDKISDLATLDLLEANIYSLLKKLVPDYPYHQTSLRLFPLLEKMPPSPYAG